MKPSDRLELYRDQIREIVIANRAKNAKYFGSVLRGEDTEESDLDLVVEPTAKTTLFDIATIRYRLRELLGVEVDVLTPRALPDRFREQVLKEAKLV